MKRFKAILVAVLAGCLLMAFTACSGGSSNSNSQENASILNESETGTLADRIQESQENYSSLMSSIMYMSMEELLEEIRPTVESQSNENMNASVTAEGDTITFTFTYLVPIDNADNSYSDYLESGLEDSSDSFQYTVNQYSSAVGKPLTLTVIYYNADGSVLASKSCSSQSN